MTYLPELFTIAIIHILAAMSPGPDFALIARNSLVYSRSVGVYSALGLAMGIVVHITYSLLGIGFIISHSIIIFSAIKFFGAGYLIYIGYKSLRSNKKSVSIEEKEFKDEITKRDSIRMGFLTNVLNPKATLFFLALFTQVIRPETPITIQLMYGLEMVVMTFVWFAIVANILSHKAIKTQFVKVQHKVERAFGVILIALGIKVAMSSSK
jgi:RhtB (resistance to homoserine/threonine) family protein